MTIIAAVITILHAVMMDGKCGGKCVANAHCCMEMYLHVVNVLVGCLC